MFFSAAEVTLLSLPLQVRMSPDNLKAYILWDSYLGKTDAVQQELDRR